MPSSEDVRRYHQDLGHEAADAAALAWVCTYLDTHIHERALTVESLSALNHAIHLVPTGRQRRLKVALDQVLLYLYEVCDWSLPEKNEARCRNRAFEWMLDIQHYNHDASRVLHGYQQQRIIFMAQREVNLGWLLWVLYVEVAPLPLSYWQATLAQGREAVEPFEGQFTVKVPHPQPIASYATKQQASITRLSMPLFAWRVWQDYWDQAPDVPTLTQLLQALNGYAAAKPYYLVSRTAANWQRVFQALWHHHYQVPALLLRDISEPLRHVATLEPVYARTLTPEVVQTFFEPVRWQVNAPPHRPDDPNKMRWPHKALLQYHRRNVARSLKSAPTPPPWSETDVAPKLLYHFAEALLTEGGVKRDELLVETIDRYTNFYLNLTPLSYQEAADPTALAKWAQQTLASLSDKESQRWHFYQFLRSVSQQELTDHLDLAQFEKPTLPSRVDPFRLGVSQVHQVVKVLLGAPRGHALQRLFASVAALLGFYGALRRGEVLRLRVGDIRMGNQQEKCTCFYLTITCTDEGKTKSGATRHVYVVMPQTAATLVRVVMKIHARSDKEQPLLAMCGESIHSRASHYLYPVTQVLKALFGRQVRFHHLRHSGAELLYLQGLHLAYGRDEQHLEAILNDPAMQAQLTPAACMARFEFWLEGRRFEEVNDSLLLDVIGNQLGHVHYGTTRRHYLHGLERVLPLFKPRKREYSRDELRYLLGMSATSNDTSRVLDQLCPDYAVLEGVEKKLYTPTLCEAQLFAALNRQRWPARTTVAVPDQPFLPLWADNTRRKWVTGRTLSVFNGETMRPLANGTLDMVTLSAGWTALGKHDGLTLTAQEIMALKRLGPPQVVESQTTPPCTELVFKCACNQETRAAFLTLCQQGPFSAIPATLTLVQNRKCLKSRKLAWLSTEFARSKDTVTHRIIAEGNTHLVIQLHTPIPAFPFMTPLRDYLATLIEPRQR